MRQRTLRVAIDATPLLSRPTGVGVFCGSVLRAVGARADTDVSAFAISWRRRRNITQQLPPGVTAQQRPMPARPLHFLWHRRDWPPVEVFVPPSDVVHGTNFVVPPTRRSGAVLTIHDLTVVRFPELCDGATLAFPDLIRRALRRGAWVHTHSHYVADEVVDSFGADPERVRAVASGVPPLPCPGAGHPADLGVGTDRYILSIGTAEPRKDLPGLVGAFNDVAAADADVSLVLAGPPGWRGQALEEAIARSPFAGRIIRPGWVDDATLAMLLDRAAVLAYPSLYEGFGFPPVQAMAAGVPVVSTTAGSLPEVIGSAGLLVPPGDRAALAEALDAVLHGDELRTRLVGEGRRRVDEFTWERTAAGLIQLYRDVVDDRARPIGGRRGGSR